MSTETKVVGAWAIGDATPSQVSTTLKHLRVSHTVVGWSHTKKARAQRIIDGLCNRQPAWPVVCHSVKDIPRYQTKKSRVILFVCDSPAALGHTNLTQLATNDSLENRIVTALLSPWQDWKFCSTEPAILDYVQIATKPSFLRAMQTAVYRINPYDFRKEVQSHLILYLGGQLPYAKVKRLLKSSLKSESILDLLESPEAKTLQAALECVGQGWNPEAAADHFDIDVFDINYIRASLSKQK
jgi:hypothetical protein